MQRVIPHKSREEECRTRRQKATKNNNSHNNWLSTTIPYKTNVKLSTKQSIVQHSIIPTIPRPTPVLGHIKKDARNHGETQILKACQNHCQGVERGDNKKIISKGTEYLNIPFCSIPNNRTEENDLEETLKRKGTSLKHIGIAGYYGNDYIMAIIICRSVNLTVLDMSKTRAKLVNTIIHGLPDNTNIRSLNISNMDDHNPKKSWDEALQFDTIKNIVNKCKKLTNWILFSTNLRRKSIAYICVHLTPSIK